MLCWILLTSRVCIFCSQECWSQVNVPNEISEFFLQMLAGVFKSEYSVVSCCRLLKPYIRRDKETTPLWLRLLGEVQAKANRNIPHWCPPRRHPIDYSYVRPQHMSSINSLCREFFYPGIDCRCICLHYTVNLDVLCPKPINSNSGEIWCGGLCYIILDILPFNLILTPREAHFEVVQFAPEWFVVHRIAT
jgi:hypothetical protein